MLSDIRFLLKTKYSGSRALIIGIDDYTTASPLSYAVSDAKAVKDVIVSNLGFPEEDVVCLFNADATKTSILHAYSLLTDASVDVDERIIVFFAGHGYTRSGYRGEIGYLVPSDADLIDPSSLIRWNELTENSELIRAKHVLFVMDACYGGLALTRTLPAGSTRFLRDMLLRYSRQVLTAGKADEVVADSGGPIPNHSVFTGHLIQGLQGAAVGGDGILTASGLMAYVYSKVATDKNSRQTPHYGHFDGDGDMILLPSELDKKDEDDATGLDTLIVVPVATEDPSQDTTQGKIETVKSLLSLESESIKLHDFVMNEVQVFLAKTSEDSFALSETYSDDELLDRISQYEEVASDLSIVLACIAYWAKPVHRIILQKALARSTDRLELQGGLSAWLALRWYPTILEFYYSGIASVQGRRYDSLSSIFFTSVGASEYGRDEHSFMGAMSRAILELARIHAFKRIPGHEKQYVPMSEYLFKGLQPQIDDVLFVGADYERTFDEFESLFALSVVDSLILRDEHVWAPIGRFGWKHKHGSGPILSLIEEARSAGEDWLPFKAGLFGGETARFEAATKACLDLIRRMGWH